MTNPKPASPLPWKVHGLTGATGADGKPVGQWNKDAHYAVWAANNAPAMAARIERLEAALRFYAEPHNYKYGDYESTVIHDAGDIARKALQ